MWPYPKDTGNRRMPDFTFVATVKVWCLAISSPRSHVNELRSDVGSLRICRLSAATTAALSLKDPLQRAA